MTRGVKREYKKQRGSIGKQRGSAKELKASTRDPKASRVTKRALAREQSGEPLVSDESRVALGSGILYIYIERVPQDWTRLAIYTGLLV